MTQITLPHSTQEAFSWQKPFDSFPSLPVFKENQEWFMEIGPGNGQFISWIAQQYPNRNFLAIEIKRGRFLKVSEKIENLKLKNLSIIHGDARKCLEFVIPPHSLSEIYILFPDPWPKRRHNKHRMVSFERTTLLSKFLKKEGVIWTATDHAIYAEQIQNVFSPTEWKMEETSSLYPTYFETKWKKLGKKIFYFKFTKIDKPE